ncbi:MAG TPA: hypothetical protein VK586_14250, partial [Streptosporangiaceae bacterium]|nr:hypothetical protein [Streptosporangiaceae bacterium]
MLLSRRLRGGFPWTAAAALAALTLLFALSAGPAAAQAGRGGHPGGAPAVRSHHGWVKYYIVQPPRHGHAEFLFEIAAKTLGNGDRAAQIFQLNKGRPQPGGRRMEKETIILPGWILVLPASARGTGVHYGPLPVVTAAPPPAPPGRSWARILEEGEGVAVGGGLVLLALLLTGAMVIMGRRQEKHGRAAPPDGSVLPPGPVSSPRAPGGGTPDAAGATSPSLTPAGGGVLTQVHAPSGSTALGEPEMAYSQAAPNGHAVVRGQAPFPALPGADRPGGPGYPAWLNSAPPPAPPPPPAPAPRPAPDARHARHAPEVAAPSGATNAIDATGELPWPDFLAAGGPDRAGSAAAPVAGARAVPWPDLAGPMTGELEDTVLNGSVAGDRGRAGELPGNPADSEGPAALSAVALRILGTQRSSAHRGETTDVPTQRYTIASGGDWIQAVLMEAPAVRNDDKRRTGRTWLASTPYLVWTPLPYDAPDNGVAFACLGTGDKGCLFIDLAAAPGAITITGEADSAARLAESIAHQLCMASEAGRPCIVVAVGAALPEPPPPGAAWVASLGDLAASVPPPG